MDYKILAARIFGRVLGWVAAVPIIYLLLQPPTWIGYLMVILCGEGVLWVGKTAIAGIKSVNGGCHQ